MAPASSVGSSVLRGSLAASKEQAPECSLSAGNCYLLWATPISVSCSFCSPMVEGLEKLFRVQRDMDEAQGGMAIEWQVNQQSPSHRVHRTPNLPAPQTRKP